jgi:hypothetical protein
MLTLIIFLIFVFRLGDELCFRLGCCGLLDDWLHLEVCGEERLGQSGCPRTSQRRRKKRGRSGPSSLFTTLALVVRAALAGLAGVMESKSSSDISASDSLQG